MRAPVTDAGRHALRRQEGTRIGVPLRRLQQRAIHRGDDRALIARLAQRARERRAVEAMLRGHLVDECAHVLARRISGRFRVGPGGRQRRQRQCEQAEQRNEREQSTRHGLGGRTVAREWYHRAEVRSDAISARPRRGPALCRNVVADPAVVRTCRHDLPVLPPAALHARPRDRARHGVREPRRRGPLRDRAGVGAASRAVAGHGDGARVPQPGRARRGTRQERRAHRRTRRARVRLHRVRHRHAAPAARQSEAAPLPAAGGRSARQPARLQQRRRRAVPRQCGPREVAAASWASTSARTSTRRMRAPRTTISPACAPSTAAPPTSPSTFPRRTPRDCATCKRKRRSARLLARAQGGAEGPFRTARQVHADGGQDRTRSHHARHRRHRAAPRPARDRRRGRHEHDAEPATASPGSRTPTKPVGSPAGRCARGRRPSWRGSPRHWTVRCRSSAWAASCRARMPRKRSTPAPR